MLFEPNNAVDVYTNKIYTTALKFLIPLGIILLIVVLCLGMLIE